MKRILLVLFLALSSCAEDPVMYDISVSSAEGGTASLINGSFEEGKVLTITATPNAEYEFKEWSNGSTQNPLILTVTSDLTLIASFIKKQYELTITKEGEGVVNERVINTGRGYDSGTKVELTAVPAGEWVFTGWSGDFTSTDNPVQITISSQKNLNAKFVKRKYQLNINIEGQGSVLEEVVNTGRTTEYDSGTTVKLTATSSEGWKFSEWKGDLNSTTNSIQLNINSTKSITAFFIPEDSDGDGVNDDLDECPETPNGEEVNESGCSDSQIDTDGDGIADSVDQDNSTREGVPVDEYGVMLNPVYLDENGVTVKAYEWAEARDKGIINDVEYVVADIEYLYALRNNNDWERISKAVTSKITYFPYNFFYGKAPTKNALKSWDVSKITSMKDAFNFCGSTDLDLSFWDVSNVTNMSGMFRDCDNFNGDISTWDVSNVTVMSGMFLEAFKFNGDISQWNVSKVTDFAFMFHQAVSFNQDLSGWDVSSAKNMIGMFKNTTFNQNIGDWNVSNVTLMGSMFWSAQEFNQDISNWNVNNVNDMQEMFKFALSFNYDLSKWNVTNVTKCFYFSANTDNWVLPKPNFTNCIE